MKNDTFVIKKHHKFPKGVGPEQRQAVIEYWKKARGVDLTQPQYEMYSRKEQEKERKQKLALDRRTIKANNNDEYYKNCNKLRAQGYEYSPYGFSTGNWKSILNKESQLISKGHKTKVSYYKGWYTLWVK